MKNKLLKLCPIVLIIPIVLYGNFFFNVIKDHFYNQKYATITCVLSGNDRLYLNYPVNICVDFKKPQKIPFATNTILPSLNKNLTVGQHIQVKDVTKGIPLKERVPFNFRSNNIYAILN